MIVKGIIKSIDYTGNTCTVRIPVFESAANENEVVVPATLSTLPGIYNGYKEEDVVFIAFENNDYDMPIVIGKLYLGVENEKNDPRGAIVCNNITAAQPISIPISSQLTLDNDPQHSPIIGVDKGIDSYKSIADLAKNLQKQDEKLGSLSVKVIDDGENLGAEIAKKVSITDEATKQRGLGWNLNTEKWEIYAKDTVGDTNSLAKLPIMTIDRTGMVISGNLVLTGYPQTTEIKYTNSTDKNTPPTGDDVKWQDNTNDLYTDEHYIWKRTREVFYAYNAETDKWELTKYGDAHYECITGAKGDSGYNTVTVMLYKRSKTSISGEQISDDLYYKFSDQKLYKDNAFNEEYKLPTGWSYTINGAGSSSNGDLYCIAAVAHSNTESDKILLNEWVGPTLYVENGADGKPGVYIKEVKQWYILKASSFQGTEQELKDIKPTNNDEPTYNPAPTPTTADKWMSTPPEAVNGYNIWTCYGSIFSDDIPSDSKKRHIEYSIPVKDNAYALAQGKTTNYYSPTEPTNNIKEGDCWFDTGYVKIAATPGKKAEYLGKFVLRSDSDPVQGIDPNDKIYVQGIEPNTDGTFTRFIPSTPSLSQLYMIKVGPDNIDTLISNKTIVVGTTEAFETGNLKQCSSLDANGKATWTDIAGELVTNKLTAKYIDAMDITSKKIQVLASNNDTLFLADGINGNGEVNIGGFTVDSNRLYAGNPGTSNSIELASSHKLIAYKSNNKGVASSYAVSKITVNKATDLTVYIRSYAESNFDYTMISNPNVSSYPKSYSSSDVKAHTRSKQNSSSALAGYTKVEYYGLKQNNWIYVVYSKDKNTDLGTDTGYLLIPETTDISIEAVNDTDYTFERDASLDTKEAGASLKVGSNFSVDSTGAIKSTSGTIGGFEVTSDDLHTVGKTIGNPDSLFLSSTGITNRSGIGGSSGDQTWSITAGGNFGVTKSGTVYANDMVITAGYTDTIRIGTAWAGMYFHNIFSDTDKNDCYVRANEIKNTGASGYKIVFNDSQDPESYSASINIKAKKPATSGPFQETHYAWEQGIELKTYNPADKTSGALANNAALRIGYYSSQGSLLPAEANKARGFLGDVWCPTGIFRCKNGNIVPYIYGFKSGLVNRYSDEFEYGFYFDSERLDPDSWTYWGYGDIFTGISCVIVSLGLGTMYKDTRPEGLGGSKGNENPFYFDDHINKRVYWYNDTGKTWTVDVFIVGYKQRAAGTFIGEQEIK